MATWLGNGFRAFAAMCTPCWSPDSIKSWPSCNWIVPTFWLCCQGFYRLCSRPTPTIASLCGRASESGRCFWSWSRGSGSTRARALWPTHWKPPWQRLRWATSPGMANPLLTCGQLPSAASWDPRLLLFGSHYPCIICAEVARTCWSWSWSDLCSLGKIRNLKHWQFYNNPTLTCSLLVAGLGIAIDTYWHGQLIVTPYEFLKYNIFNNIGSFYGSHPWHWYFSVGLPTVLGINTLPFIFGVMETVKKSEKYPVSKQLLITIFLTLVVLSAVEHKEFRFVSPLLPLCLYVITDALSRWSIRASSTMLWTTALVILVGNVMPAWYLSTVHQKGPIELMPKLREIAREYRDEREHQANILFLMPCHSTPYYR